ncbi:nitrate reductase (quinol-dependent), catalytic subunit [Neorhodopirellula lusitana]|uniref:Nitrate reductase (Quinol-dependent), catalytic subunit n=1 Tax=Neorhodopirellula lusitana TaxID=445327 RepID=A0ABY1QHK8_9BACT|nr:nitrate reductase [Neorhodopirellula lusitana]SMP71757.1 nitrate reductase (quinol-dependent), catalytic subunit [Neorhodopirellula lusitana]
MSLAEDPSTTSRITLPKVKLPELLQRRDGSMTRELLLKPGQHGLGMTHDSMVADTTTTATCGYCSTGCGLRLHLRDGEAVGLTPETQYPVNLGMACPKGWEALRVLDSDERATTPLLRDANGKMQPIEWEAAFTTFVDKMRGVQEKHGQDSVAFLSTGQIPSEEMAFLGALARFGMGIRHGDGNTRQCMATAVTAYKESFGFDAPPFTYDDFEQSDCLIFIGANPCIGHPIMWERVLRNPNTPEIIVIDPRRTETAMAATQHLQVKPKHDLAILYAITKLLIDNGYVDRQFVEGHTNGFEELCEHVSQFDVDTVAHAAGVSVGSLEQVAHTIGTRKAVSLWWTMGVNQSYEGTRTAQAMINIALITGNIGRPGTGANSITGQCNAMGSRLWSGTTNLLGHHSFASEQDRQKVADVLGFDSECIPTTSSWRYDRIIEGVRNGEIKALWVIATNPAHSWIDQADVKELFGKLDFLVVQDMYDTTETAEHADLIFPTAGWGEKEGTFINSERRYGLLKKVRRAPGQALSDFQILRGIAHYWGVGEQFAEWTDPEAVFRIMQRASRGQPCDITGIDGYAHIDRCGGIQWPWTEADAAATGSSEPPQQRRLFEDGRFFYDDGKAKLIVDDITPMPEPPTQKYPVTLLTGRGTVSQWHTQTRTKQSPVLGMLYPQEAYVEINPVDADEWEIVHGDTVTIESRRGKIEANACVTATVRRGQAFIPMHYAETNQLTLSHFDPHSGQPSYKDCAVRITPKAPQSK